MRVILLVFCVSLIGIVTSKSIGKFSWKSIDTSFVSSTCKTGWSSPLPLTIRQHFHFRLFSYRSISFCEATKDEETSIRQKRQFGGGFARPPQFGQSSSQANANAFNQFAGPGGFGASSAMAGAQGFQSQGPLGGFGASSANSASQGFQAGPGGITGNAGFSGSQNYNLPNNHHVNLAYGQTGAFNNGQATGGDAFSLTYDK